jgi:hypothetical protein
MADYIRRLSGPQIVGASWSIYFGNWRVLIGIYLPPILPVVALEGWFELQGSLAPLALSVVLLVFVSIFTGAAVTIAIGDLCLQRPMSVSRSWRLALNLGFWRVLGTQCLAFGLVLIGMVFFIIPGMILGLMFMFTTCIVALENLGGMRALHRSRELARGMLWRNFGVLLLVGIVTELAALLIGALLGLAAALLGFSGGQSGASFAAWLWLFVTRSVAQLAVFPQLIAIVLLYYDMRARKEAFDSTALARELMY